MKDKLKELLDYQISGLLTKIDEELASVNSDTENWLNLFHWLLIFDTCLIKMMISFSSLGATNRESPHTNMNKILLLTFAKYLSTREISKLFIIFTEWQI